MLPTGPPTVAVSGIPERCGQRSGGAGCMQKQERRHSCEWGCAKHADAEAVAVPGQAERLDRSDNHTRCNGTEAGQENGVRRDTDAVRNRSGGIDRRRRVDARRRQRLAVCIRTECRGRSSGVHCCGLLLPVGLSSCDGGCICMGRGRGKVLSLLQLSHGRRGTLLLSVGSGEIGCGRVQRAASLPDALQHGCNDVEPTSCTHTTHTIQRRQRHWSEDA